MKLASLASLETKRLTFNSLSQTWIVLPPPSLLPSKPCHIPYNKEMMRNYIFRNGLLLVALLTIFLFSPATASWTALNLVTETPEQGQKLQHCQGHCRDDEDCEVGLKCVLRSNDDFEELLEQFQCTGTLEYEVNYCVDTWWSHRPTADEKSLEEHTPTGDDFPIRNKIPQEIAHRTRTLLLQGMIYPIRNKMPQQIAQRKKRMGLMTSLSKLRPLFSELDSIHRLEGS